MTTPIPCNAAGPVRDGPAPDLLGRFAGQRILVVGDVMLDEYLWGAVRRISPEAPVAVVEVQGRSQAPGGAANTAANLAGLRAAVALLGVVGADEAGARLQAALQERGVSPDGLLIEPGRPTTTKTRILAHNQQMLRLDQEQRAPLPAAVAARLLGLLERRLPESAGCVVADYAKGVVSAPLARRLIELARALDRPVVVDPKGPDFTRYRGSTLVKPNLHEASLFLGREVASTEEVLQAGRQLLELLEGSAVLITRGSAGMTLFQQGQPALHVAARAREVYDVTGAGDTVAAVLALALSAGASLEQAAQLASQAAALTVARLGTAAVTLEDLMNHCAPTHEQP